VTVASQVLYSFMTNPIATTGARDVSAVVSTRPRFAVIFNPVAGSPKRREALARAVRTLRKAGCRVKLRATTAAGDAARSAANIAKAGTFDAILVAGGDGTLSDAAHGLATANVARLPALAFLPLGTANVMAHEIGLPTDPEKAAAVAVRLKTVDVPLATANDRHFLLMVGAGFDAHVVRHVKSAVKKRWGKLAYVAEMVRQLGKFPFRPYRVTIDGVAFEAASVVATRGRLYGGRFVLAPSADLRSPTLQVCLFRNGGRGFVLLYAVALGLGLLPRAPGFEIVTARRVTVEGIEGEPVQADGDSIASLPLEIAMTDKSLRLVVP
jgi:diacylglycerol kinase (ATP)